ncbi:MAG: SH3 domain-containing protein, partial [Bacillota bacterium]
AGVAWFLGSRNLIGLPGWVENIIAPEEEKVVIRLPENLFPGQDFEEISARAIEEQNVEEVTQDEDGDLIYTMSYEVRDNLLAEAKRDLENKLAAINDQGQHSEVIRISYDSNYKDFYLVADENQQNRALVTAADLFILAVYYQYISTEDLVREVSILIEDNETGEIMEQLEYPGDLNTAAGIIEDPPDLAEEPTTPQPGDKVVVSTGPDNLNLRNGPEITYLIIDILKSGTVLEVTGSEGVWLEVITPEGTEGWVHGDFVEPHDDES